MAKKMVDGTRLELAASGVRFRRSPKLSYPPKPKFDVPYKFLPDYFVKIFFAIEIILFFVKFIFDKIACFQRM